MGRLKCSEKPLPKGTQQVTRGGEWVPCSPPLQPSALHSYAVLWWFSTRADVVPQQTFGSVWRHT